MTQFLESIRKKSLMLWYDNAMASIATGGHFEQVVLKVTGT